MSSDSAEISIPHQPAKCGFFIGWNMKTGTLHYKMTLRRYMYPLFIIGALINSTWLVNLCYKKEIVFEGQEVELSGE